MNPRESLRRLNARYKLLGGARALRDCRWSAGPVVHVGYHKCLTWLFMRLFEWCQEIFDVPLFVNHSGPIGSARHGVFFNHQGVPPRLDGISFRGSHVIRDPRDLVVSAYFYHLRTDENWCIHPTPRNDDLPSDTSYQEHLRRLDLEDGIIFEMNHVSGAMIDRMCSWDYSDSRFLEVRFEDIVDNEVEMIERLLSWYGLCAEDAAVVSSFLDFLSFDSVKRAAKKKAIDRRHIGHGHPVGKWRACFSDKVRAAFDERFPEALAILGYE
jgi:hypothetical protein